MKGFAFLIFCFSAISAIGGPPGAIVDSSDLARGARLAVRYNDGDKSFENDIESVASITAVLNYLEGFSNCAVITENVSKDSIPFLIPKGYNSPLLARVVDKYIADHPEKMSDPPGVIVWNALFHAFPNKDFKNFKSE
jgi:hypothetical protein